MATIPSAAKRTTVLLAVLAAIIAIVVVLTTLDRQEETAAIDSFEDCAAAGHPIMESYPERCAVPGGETFTKQY